jgi:hypothetical protein
MSSSSPTIPQLSLDSVDKVYKVNNKTYDRIAFKEKLGIPAGKSENIDRPKFISPASCVGATNLNN